MFESRGTHQLCSGSRMAYAGVLKTPSFVSSTLTRNTMGLWRNAAARSSKDRTERCESSYLSRPTNLLFKNKSNNLLAIQYYPCVI